MIHKLLHKAKKKDKDIDPEIITKAWEFCKERHGEQKRITGEPFYEHPYEVAMKVIDFVCDTDIVCAALLHDVVEDTNTSLAVIRVGFGDRVAFMVDALTKDKTINDIEIYHKKFMEAADEEEAIYYLKFADILHNLETVQVLGKERAIKFIDEVLDFYEPLAQDLKEYQIAEDMRRLSEEALENVNSKIDK